MTSTHKITAATALSALTIATAPSLAIEPDGNDAESAMKHTDSRILYNYLQMLRDQSPLADSNGDGVLNHLDLVEFISFLGSPERDALMAARTLTGYVRALDAAGPLSWFVLPEVDPVIREQLDYVEGRTPLDDLSPEARAWAEGVRSELERTTMAPVSDDALHAFVRSGAPQGTPPHAEFTPHPRTGHLSEPICITEPDGRAGAALIYPEGPVNTPNYQEVCLTFLGEYDEETGFRIASNSGRLNGKYLQTGLRSIDEYDPDFPYNTWDEVPEFMDHGNDFRLSPECWDYPEPGQDACPDGVSQREAHLWTSEVHVYHYITDYRRRFLNNSFVDSLDLPADIRDNLKNRQYRPDLNMSGGEAEVKPRIRLVEGITADGLGIVPDENKLTIPVRTRGNNEPFYSRPVYSSAFDPELLVGEYAGLVSFWVIGDNAGFPPEGGFSSPSFWTNNILPALNDGLTAWVGHRYTGNTEVYKNFLYGLRTWNPDNILAHCGGVNYPCDKGLSVKNVMMINETQIDAQGVFPFRRPFFVNPDYGYDYDYEFRDGPNGSDLAAMFFAALYYDIANEAGLGGRKADMLIWKSISLVDDANNLSMREYGSKVLEAARLLWPSDTPVSAPFIPPTIDGGAEMLSIYEQDIADVLTSRGIPLYGVASFKDNLPTAIGSYPESLEKDSPNGFGSSHPETQPDNWPGFFNYYWNGYSHLDAQPADYVAYKVMKHAKYGPCDYLAVTDGTLVNSDDEESIYQNDGSFYHEIRGRELGNKVIFAPGNHIRWLRIRKRCAFSGDNDGDSGYYVEDTRPLGFRVESAMTNGFSIHVESLGDMGSFKRYAVTPVDPSFNTLGDAQYDYEVTDFMGVAATFSGAYADRFEFDVPKDEPFTIRITRTRGSDVDMMEFRERANDFDRESGAALYRNLIP